MGLSKEEISELRELDLIKEVNGERWLFEEVGSSHSALWRAWQLDENYEVYENDFHFSFDCEKVYPLNGHYRDYMTPEQIEIFDRNWPYWTPDKGLPRH